MRKLLYVASLTMAISASPHKALAYEDGIFVATALGTSSPLLTTLSPLRLLLIGCNERKSQGRPHTSADIVTETAFSCEADITSAATSTSALFLLKEVQAAQPDALDYIGGSAPSPILYSATQKIHEFYSEKLHLEISFEDAVDVIIYSDDYLSSAQSRSSDKL